MNVFLCKGAIHWDIREKVFWWASTGSQLFLPSETYNMWPDLTKPTVGHLCHRSFSLDWNRNITTILNAKGASTKVSIGGFCQIATKNFAQHFRVGTLFYNCPLSAEVCFFFRSVSFLYHLDYSVIGQRSSTFQVSHKLSVFVFNHSNIWATTCLTHVNGVAVVAFPTIDPTLFPLLKPGLSVWECSWEGSRYNKLDHSRSDV